MKKLIAILVAIFILFSLVACGGSDANDGKIENAETELLPATDLPEYTEEFNFVREQVIFNELVIADFIALAINAYDSYEGKEFCEFVYTEMDIRTITAISDAISAKSTEIISDDPDSEAFDVSLDLQDFNKKLLNSITEIAGLNVTYLGTDESDTEALEELKDDYAFWIDCISEIVYGAKLVTE